MKKNPGCFTIILVIIFLPIAIPFVILYVLSGLTKTKDTKSKYSDEELVAWGLLDYEKKEVKKGNYEPWQFSERSEEELEDDDYYF